MSEIDEEKENKKLEAVLKVKLPHRYFGIGARQWFCDNCKKKILTYDVHFHCLECDDYDLCNDCYPSHGHKHENNMDWFCKMLEPTWYFTHRLKEGVKADATCTTILMECFQYYGERYFIGTRNDTKTKIIKWHKYIDIFNQVVEFSKGLREMGYKKGDFIGVLGNIQLEYIIIFYACLYLGITFVPIQTILSRDEKKYVITQTNVKGLFFSTEYTKEVMILKEKCPCIKDLFLLSNVKYIKFIKKFDEILKMGRAAKNKNIAPSVITENDLVTVIYTSGTTGFPKGIVFRGKTFLEEMTRLNLSIPLVILSFLPYSHISGLSDIMLSFFNGGRVCLLTNSDMKNVFDDFQLYNPTILSTIPRILNFVYNQYHMLIKSKVPKKEVEKKLEHVFGTRIIEIVVGSAPCSMDVKQLIREVCKLPVIDGYGISEVGTVSFNYGKMDGVDYKLLDCPELGYTKNDKPYPRGELIVRNDLTKELEYYKNDKITKERFDEDGFFHTGDIVELRGEKIVIIDRKNNILKMAQGEFISVEKIESILESSKFIDQFLIMANPTKEKLVALAVALDKNVRKGDVMEDIVKIGKEYGLNAWEIPRNIHVVYEKFKLTELKKKNRKRIKEQYKKEIKMLFEEKEDNTIIDMLKKMLKGGIKSGIDGKKSFKELGGDSLSGTMLIKNMQMLGKDVKYDDLMKKPIDEIIKVISGGGDGKDSKVKGKKMDDIVSIVEEEKKFKKCLNELNVKYGGKKEKGKKEYGNIFVTGTSGFIGRYLLVELLIQYPKSNIYLLVRKGSESKLKFKSNPRLHIITGDVSKDNFGLSSNEFNDLSNKIDIIIHGAAMVNHFLSYDDHYDANVGSLYNIIKLAQGWKPIVYLSSLSVYAEYPPKKNIWDERHKRKDGYGASKWVTDCLLTRNYSNCIIYRLTLVIGSRNTGETNMKDWFTRIVQGVYDYKMAPEEGEYLNTPLDMIPVDVVSYSIVKGIKKGYFGKQFTLSYGNSTFGDIFKYLEKYLLEEKKELLRIPYNGWVKIMDQMCKQNKHPMLPFVGLIKNIRYDKFDTKLYEDLIVKDDYRYPKGMLQKVEYKDVVKYLNFIKKQ